MHKKMTSTTTTTTTTRRPLFPIDALPDNAITLNTQQQTQNKLLLFSRILRILRLNWKTITSATIIALLALLWYYPLIFCIFLLLCYSAILIIIAVAGTAYVHYICTHDPPKSKTDTPKNILYKATNSSLLDFPRPIKNATNLPLIFGKSVDLQMQQILEYVLRDFMSPWLGHVVTKPNLINDMVREDLWHAIQKVRDRATKLDSSKIIAVDMVNRITVHLEKIRIAEARVIESKQGAVFSTHPYLIDEDNELAFLRKLSEIMIIVLLPRGYSVPPLKILLSEIVSYKIIFPLIKILTSPDYINQKIVQNIESRLAAAAINKRSYEYAASFEDFLRIINNSGNLEELSLIRKSIVNDLMHATSMQNIQRSRGMDPDNEDHTNLSKSDISAGIRLKRYVSQLTMAKVQCEKNLSKFGWNGNYSSDIDLTLQEILLTDVGRRYLTLFLEQMKAGALVGFYVAVEELKRANSAHHHQMGTEIFYTYIRVPKPEIQIDKHERKLIEAFLLGDAGPDVFYDIQRNVLQTLEQQYYAPFVLSDQYRQLKEALNSDDFNNAGFLLQGLHESVDEHVVGLNGSGGNIVEGSSATINVTAHSCYARRRLEQLQERIEKKAQALDALKNSVKPESKVLQVLEKEMDWLKSEKRQTEAHLRRTDAWTDHIGKWKATIQSVEMSDEKESLQLMILVHVDEDINLPNKHNPAHNEHNKNKTDTRPGSISSGWAIMRSLNQVHELHRKLRHVNANLKSMDLPTNFKFFFLKNDKSALDKAKAQIQKFLNYILEDEHLNASEAIYTFLSPSSDHLKQTLPSPKKSKFSLSTLFKSEGTKAQEFSKANDPFWGLHRDEENITNFLEGESAESKLFAIDAENKDSIAEPLYALMGEIFDMGGVFKWIRKSLISFVQMTYGSTINRQIRVSVNYLFEESMLHYYFSAILKSFWPGGVLASAYPVRSDDMKEMTTNAAKALLMDHVPEVLCNLVGAQAGKHGVLKVFNALQNPVYNKQLFYDFVEILMVELFPEIRQMKVVSKKEQSNYSSGNISTTGAGVGATTTISSSILATNINNSIHTNVTTTNTTTTTTTMTAAKIDEKTATNTQISSNSSNLSKGSNYNHNHFL